MIEVGIAIIVAATVMALYQGFRGGFDYLNQLRMEAKANVMTAPLWLTSFMIVAVGTLIAALIFVWATQVWLVSLAVTVGMMMVSVSIKMVVMPRSESAFYRRCFGE